MLLVGIGSVIGIVIGERMSGAVNSGTAIPSLAREILVIEGESDPTAAVSLRLERLIQSAVARFESVNLEGENEAARARRFFEAVDRILIEGDVIFPPAREIDFLSDGLRLRTLSQTEFTQAEARFGNARRLPWMRANQQAGGEFCFFDCDLAAIVYVTAAERLGLPVFVVELPGHTFVRWTSKTVSLNWDPNDGVSYPDDYYIKTWHVPVADEIWPRFFEILSRARVLSTWSVLCGREKQARGDFQGALSAFRSAVKADPTDFGAANELAWLLATCPLQNHRNGPEAVILAKANVAHMPRAVWLQTLAAAQAEIGDFDAAIKTEQAAQHASDSALGWASPREILRNHHRLLAAYRRGQTFAEAVAADSALIAR